MADRHLTPSQTVRWDADLRDWYTSAKDASGRSMNAVLVEALTTWAQDHGMRRTVILHDVSDMPHTSGSVMTTATTAGPGQRGGGGTT
jgi:hypothetical protein